MITFTVEDGTGKADANSYASVAQGDDYHAARLYSEAWSESGPSDHQKALMMATALIDSYWAFRGSRASDAQALHWPRAYVRNTDRSSNFIFDGTNLLAGLANYGTGYFMVYPVDYIPARLIAATCEMARLLLERDRTTEDSAKGLQSLSIGSGALSFTFDPADRKTVFTAEVDALLYSLGTKIGSSGSGFKPLVRV